MIDSAELARLSAWTHDHTISDERNQLKLARVIYTAGAKRMQERAADECERMIMYPGGRQECQAHNNVWDAATAIRKLEIE